LISEVADCTSGIQRETIKEKRKRRRKRKGKRMRKGKRLQHTHTIKSIYTHTQTIKSTLTHNKVNSHTHTPTHRHTPLWTPCVDVVGSGSFGLRGDHTRVKYVEEVLQGEEGEAELGTQTETRN